MRLGTSINAVFFAYPFRHTALFW